MNSEKLKQLEFDLAYLAMLTQRGLKPLSRWERPLPAGGEALFTGLDLEIGYARRRLGNGSETVEFLFSRSGQLIDLYLERFDGRAADPSPQSRRIEGFLFGYPPCCVEHYIRHGYRDNGLSPEDQRILFHWTCPGCAITPLLLPAYWETYRDCRRLFAHGTADLAISRLAGPVKRGAAVAAAVCLAAAAVTSVMPVPAAAATPDSHWLALPDGMDRDSDFLRDSFEAILGCDNASPDSDNDGVLDGPQAAAAMVQRLASLPHFDPFEPVPDDVKTPYIVDHLLRGIETCGVCGISVNMGHAVIVNPLENLSIELPYISLHHFLEHGSFAFKGDVHGTDWINAALLHTVLTSGGSAHQIAAGADRDRDGLTDDEEILLDSDSGNPDSNGDGVTDGAQWARALAGRIDALPRTDPSAAIHIVEHPMFGLEICHVCGQTLNMGFIEIVNREQGRSCSLPYIAHHALSCGAFSYSGDENSGRVDIQSLLAVLQPGDPHHLPLTGDRDSDGLKDGEEDHFQMRAENPDSDGDGVNDGAQVAATLKSLIESLPQDRRSDGPFIEHFMMRGLETCRICAGTVNMGYFRIVHPVKNDSLELPYIALHVLEHGALRYLGDLHQGRIDPVRLADLLSGIESSVDPNGTAAPEVFSLGPNYPNPFNPTTLIPFELGSEKNRGASLVIYNALGQQVRRLFEAGEAPTRGVAIWDGLDDNGGEAPAGLYFARLKGGRLTRTLKMALIR